MYPTPADPTFGNFVATQMRSMAESMVRVEVDFIDGRRHVSQYLAAIWRVRRRARRGGFDLVHAHYGLTGFVSLYQPLPLVVSFCGDDLLGTPDGRGSTTLKSRLIVRLSRLAARRADGVICKSEGLRAALPRPLDRARAHVIGNGVDTRLFCPGDRLGARQRLGMRADERLVVFPHSRRQAAVKRFDLAEAAIARLASDGISARLWIVNGVSPVSMPDYYRAADCFLLTSDHEGSPNSVKEALCCDLPIVSVDAGDVRRWLKDTPGCWLVERDPIDIARKLGAVLAGPRRIDGARVRAQVSLQAVASQVFAVYQEALRRR